MTFKLAYNHQRIVPAISRAFLWPRLPQTAVPTGGEGVMAEIFAIPFWQVHPVSPKHLALALLIRGTSLNPPLKGATIKYATAYSIVALIGFMRFPREGIWSSPGQELWAWIEVLRRLYKMQAMEADRADKRRVGMTQHP